MKPDESSSSQSGLPLLKPNGLSDSNNSSNNSSKPQNNEAATNIIRSQIDSIYQSQAYTGQPQLKSNNPYKRTHTEAVTPTTTNWQHYHTAWQNYYQKYYEGYYKHHFENSSEADSAKPLGAMSVNEAEFELKQQLISKVRSSAHKVRKSRHFLPIIAGLIVACLFLFLQYNSIIVGKVVAYVSPGSINPQNIVVDPSGVIAVSSEPRLIIPKINVDVPVMWGIGSDYNSQMAAMTKGVAQFSVPGANALPGEIGNTVLAGHSSNDLFDTGDYKFIFAQLDKLVAGDTIYLNYKSVRYTYVVTKTQVVEPTNVNALVYNATKPNLTLVTCTPLGTAKYRLLVTSEQVSPDPANAVAAASSSTVSSDSMPGNSKTFWEKLFTWSW